MAKKYIKSYSNYVLKTKHQSTNDGTIYERDITTIGGRDQFAKGQVPIYGTGNFVITINNDVIDHKKNTEKDWYRSDEGEIWTLNTLKHYNKDEKSSYDKKIVIKKDYFDLRDYAYYGSCSELMRVSIENVIKKYPGELFTPYETIYVSTNGDGVQYTEEAAIAAFGENYREIKSGFKGYYTSYSLSGATEQEKEELENGIPYKREFKKVLENGEYVEKDLSIIDNPFGINMHSRFLPKGENPLKYFADGGVENYNAYLKLNDDGDIDINGKWYIDSDHEYSIQIEEILFDGLGEIEEKNISFSADTSSISACSSGSSESVNVITLTASGDISVKQITSVKCASPGTYLGRIRLVFARKSYSFKTIPGLNASGCCEKNLEFNGTKEYDENEAQISSFSIDDAIHRPELEIFMFMGDNNEVKYFVENFNYSGDTENNYKNFAIRIRPNKDVIDNFYNELSLFEKVLLNRDSDPIYTASFELISDNDYGMYTYTKQFTFPTTYGGYNIGSNGQSFSEYVGSLSDVGEYYDELFTDNLWRSMTHESIKNFDWTYTRHYTPGDEEPYTEAGTKIKKVIRLYGREFDEVKSYIDAIDDYNTITYDNVNNVPDYFFTDKLEDYGWDVKLVHPLELSEFVNGYDSIPMDIYSLFPNKYNENGEAICTEEAEKLNYFYDSSGSTKNKIAISRVFDIKNATVMPYSKSNISESYSNKYKVYSNENEYSSSDINSEFTKRLIINSPGILKHKGTIDGIEMLLAIFGLKSKNSVYNNEKFFVNKKNENETCLSLTNDGKKYYKNYYSESGSNLYDTYDYDIKEYTLFTTREEDEWLEPKNMYKFDWINSTKLITYNNTGSSYESYQGLPVSYRNENNKRYIYPHFNSYEQYDGNPYYQMNGGWMQKKPFMFDVKNNIIMEDCLSETKDEKPLFTETVKNIKCVGTIQELLSNPSLANGSGDICQVTDISGRYAVIDGYIYPLLDETIGSDSYSFFYAYINNNSLSVGNAIFTDYVVISNPYFNNNKQKIDLTDEYYNNREIKIYVIKEDGNYDIDVYSKDNSISTFTVFENGKYMEGDNYTNYFVLNNIDYYNELSVLGWKQLKTDEYEYFKLNSVVDYREGNNPHTGHMRYDNGHEYLTYLQKIFKYVSENDLIDYREYGDDELKYIDEMKNFGFKNLVDEDDCEHSYDKFLREDNKCHFFGSILSKIDDNYNDTRDGLNCFEKRDLNSSEYKITDIIRKNIINDCFNDGEETIKIKNLKYGKVYESIGESGYYDETKIDNVTDQIVNTKRFEIEFFIKNKKEFSKEWLEDVKYIDSVILPYLSQMIPSSVIWTVKYTTKNKEDWCEEEIEQEGNKGCL